MSERRTEGMKKRNRRGWRGNGERRMRVGKKGKEREDEWARRDGETKKGKEKNKGKEQRKGRRKRFILLTYSSCVRTFSARSLRSRTTVCKMGNPLQVDNKVTSNELTLTRNYFVSTRHNHCTWTISSTHSWSITRVEAADTAREHSPVLFLLRLKYFQKWSVAS